MHFVKAKPGRQDGLGRGLVRSKVQKQTVRHLCSDVLDAGHGFVWNLTVDIFHVMAQCGGRRRHVEVSK